MSEHLPSEPVDPPRVLEDDTGEHYVVLEERRRHLWLGLSTWQWSVIGAYIVTIVLATALAIRGSQTDKNTDKLSESICAQVQYLVRVAARSTPGDNHDDLVVLIRRLRSLQRCPAPQADLSP